MGLLEKRTIWHRYKGQSIGISSNGRMEEGNENIVIE